MHMIGHHHGRQHIEQGAAAFETRIQHDLSSSFRHSPSFVRAKCDEEYLAIGLIVRQTPSVLVLHQLGVARGRADGRGRPSLHRTFQFHFRKYWKHLEKTEDGLEHLRPVTRDLSPAHYPPCFNSVRTCRAISFSVSNTPPPWKAMASMMGSFLRRSSFASVCTGNTLGRSRLFNCRT